MNTQIVGLTFFLVVIVSCSLPVMSKPLNPYERANEGIVTTLAGQAALAGSADGPALSAQFNQPRGLAVVGTKMFVADSGNNSLREIDLSSGRVTTVLTGFNGPQGVAVDKAAHYVYMCDTLSNVVVRVDVALAVATFVAGTGTGAYSNGPPLTSSFSQPYGVVLDPQEKNLYVADTYNDVIREIPLDGSNVILIAGIPNSSGAVDGAAASATFFLPNALTLDPTGRFLYVADTGNNKIRQIDLITQTVTTLAGGATSGSSDGVGTAALFNQPGGISIEPTGTFLYVIDAGTSVLRQILISTGEVQTIAGSVSTTGTQDGKGPRARFNTPYSVVAYGSTVYIGDNNNATIRASQ